MLIVLLCIFIGLIIGGAIMCRRADGYQEGLEFGGIAMIIIGVIATIIAFISSLVLIGSLVHTSTIDERIAMYEEQNASIEEEIEATVKQYQDYEAGIMTEIGNKDSYITLVSLYPDLKADALVSKQIEVYISNKESISDLKNEKLNEREYRWWLYFGS